MDAISQMTFSNAFSWMKMLEFWLKCHWSLFQWPNWQQPSIGLDNGMALNMWQAIIWTNAAPVHWRIYAALGGDELIETTNAL